VVGHSLRLRYSYGVVNTEGKLSKLLEANYDQDREVTLS
jgi:hypothetical protein